MKRSIISTVLLLFGIALVTSCVTKDTTGVQDSPPPTPTPSSAKAPPARGKKPVGTPGTQNTTGRQDKDSSPTPTPSQE